MWRRKGWGLTAILQIEVADVEDVMPTLEDQRMVSRVVEAK